MTRIEGITGRADGSHVWRIIAAEQRFIENQPLGTSGHAKRSLAMRAARRNANWLVVVAGRKITDRTIPGLRRRQTAVSRYDDVWCNALDKPNRLVLTHIGCRVELIKDWAC